MKFVMLSGFILAETGVAETGVAETGVAEIGVAETGVAETGVAETGVAETGIAETDTAEIGVPGTGAVEISVPETGAAETGVVETGVVLAGLGDVLLIGLYSFLILCFICCDVINLSEQGMSIGSFSLYGLTSLILRASAFLIFFKSILHGSEGLVSLVKFFASIFLGFCVKMLQIR